MSTPDELEKSLYALGTGLKKVQRQGDNTRDQVVRILTILEGSQGLGLEGVMDRINELEKRLDKVERYLNLLTWLVGASLVGIAILVGRALQII